MKMLSRRRDFANQCVTLQYVHILYSMFPWGLVCRQDDALMFKLAYKPHWYLITSTRAVALVFE